MENNINYNQPAFPIPLTDITEDGRAVIEYSNYEGMTLLDYFAIRMPEPSKEDIQFEITSDRNKNPYNEPSKPNIRSELEIVCQLKYKRAAAMLEARKNYIK